MANYTYSYKGYNPKTMARAVGTNLEISTKKSIEACTYIRGRKLETAKKMLIDVIEMRQAVPMNRFRGGAGHKPGQGPGKYAITVCEGILSIVKSAENNAQTKGLDISSLALVHINAQRGPHQFHYGRQKRRAFKRTHIEIALGPKKEGSKKPAEKKERTPKVPKQEKAKKE